jgi:hypothetical protein
VPYGATFGGLFSFVKVHMSPGKFIAHTHALWRATVCQVSDVLSPEDCAVLQHNLLMTIIDILLSLSYTEFRMKQSDVDQLITAMKQVFPTREEAASKTELVQVKLDLSSKIDQVKQELSDKIDRAKEEVIQNVADTLHDDILPLIEKHDKRLDRVEKHLDLPPVSV